MTIKVGCIVILKDREDKYNGLTGIVRHADRYKDMYFVGNFNNSVTNGYVPPYPVAMDVTREQMIVLSMEEYPELYI